MAVKLLSPGGGSVTIADPASTASNFTLNPPLRSGQLAVDGPAFSAYRSTNQSIGNSVWTKIAFDTEEFDTNSNYDNTTNYRFQPTVSGYYQVNAAVGLSASTAAVTVAIYKNGSEFKRLQQSFTSSTAAEVTALIYMNGSTDYIEGYCYFGNAATAAGLQTHTYFQASLVRAA